MNKKIIITGILSLTLTGLLLSTMIQPVDARYGKNQTSIRTQNEVQVSEISLEELSEIESMLTVLIKDEYNARSEYQALVNEFGEITPFVNLVKAETNHIKALTQLFTVYGLNVPTENASNFVIIPSTLAEAYLIGIKAETDNIALYKAFLEKDLPINLENVFNHLMNASKSHLSIFEDYRDGKTNVVCNPTLNTLNRQYRRNQ